MVLVRFSALTDKTQCALCHSHRRFLKQGHYDVDKYRDYYKHQQTLLHRRCAKVERETAKRQKSKWGNGNAGDAAWQKIIANRPALDLTSAEDARAWSKGPRIFKASRFTPREERPRTAEGFLKTGDWRHVGSPDVVLVWWCGCLIAVWSLFCFDCAHCRVEIADVLHGV